MLTKTPKPIYKRVIGFTLKSVLIVEGVAFLASYGIWHKLNSDRDFRLYMYKNHNWVLEGYYGLGERIADQKTRDIDLKVWNSEGKL